MGKMQTGILYPVLALKFLSISGKTSMIMNTPRPVTDNNLPIVLES